MKKSFIKIALLVALFTIAPFVYAQNLDTTNQTDESINTHEVNLYLFYDINCPHCKNEIAFLDEIAPKYPRLNIRKYEISRERENLKLFQKVAKEMNVVPNGVPFTIIGAEYFVGYSHEYHSVLLESYIVNLLADPNYTDPIAGVTGVNSETEEKNNEEKKEEVPDQSFSVPLLGEISAKNVSLPLLTLALGFVDGFNPCAMWVLIFLISMLIGLKDKKKRWVLGLAFIITSAVTYFAFMSLWLNLILFIGFIIWVRVGIGLLALGGGVYSLKKGMKNNASCDVTGEEKRKKILERMKKVVHKENFLLALVGIILLAFSVNLIELVCSAGLPAVFTQVLVINGLSTLQYYLYILLYVFIFMLDDIVVFAVAMVTLEITGLTTKYSKITRIIGGVIMVIIGILLLFKPEWIMFG